MGHEAAEDTANDGKEQQIEARTPAIFFRENAKERATEEIAQQVAEPAVKAGTSSIVCNEERNIGT